jgi:hypothetical protein
LCAGKGLFFEDSGRIFSGPLARKNRAIRSKSSKAPMRFLWAFRYYPLRVLRFAEANRKNCSKTLALLPLRANGYKELVVEILEKYYYRLGSGVFFLFSVWCGVSGAA